MSWLTGTARGDGPFSGESDIEGDAHGDYALPLLQCIETHEIMGVPSFLSV